MTLLMSGGLTIGVSAIVFLLITLILVGLLLFAKAKLVPSGNVSLKVNGEKDIETPIGGTLLGALQSGGIFLSSACGGGGKCGQCRAQVIDGGGEILPTEKGFFSRKQVKDHWRLACQCKVKEDMVVQVPDEVFGVKEWECEVISNKNVATFIKEFIVALPKGEHMDFIPGSYAQIKIPTYSMDYNKDIDKSLIGPESVSYTHLKGVEIVEVEGPHPAANVGVQINHIKPVNKGEVVWTVNPADVIVIGRLFNKGVADFSRMVAITGSETTERGYVKTISGCTIKSLVNGKVLGQEHIRIISGNVLTGTKVNMDGYLGAYDNQITVIPEGDETHEFLGFAMPRFNQFSASHSYFSWLGTSKEYVIDARIKGGKRAMIMSNEYDKVFPMDIYPEYLLKAIIAFDIDKMENLGIYEVAPEDFALCEFVDTSKIELQKIVRDGLNLLYKEMN